MNVHWDQKVVELAEKPMVVSEILKFSKKKKELSEKTKNLQKYRKFVKSEKFKASSISSRNVSFSGNLDLFWKIFKFYQ